MRERKAATSGTKGVGGGMCACAVFACNCLRVRHVEQSLGAISAERRDEVGECMIVLCFCT